MASDKKITTNIINQEKQQAGCSMLDHDNKKLKAAESVAAVLRADKENKLLYINLGLGYLSDKVYVRYKTSRGRGIYVKEGCTVQAGELILLENALGTVEGIEGVEMHAAMSKVAAVDGLRGQKMSEVPDKLYSLDMGDVQVEKRCLFNEWITPWGTTLGRLASLFNHSCLPNARVSYFCLGTVLSVRATKAVTGGEELLVSYICLVEPEKARNKNLHSQWEFTCDCERCVAERDLPAHITSKISQLYEKLAAGEKLAEEILMSLSDPRVAQFVRWSLAAARYRCGNDEELVECNTECCPGCPFTFQVLSASPTLSARYLHRNEVAVT